MRLQDKIILGAVIFCFILGVIAIVFGIGWLLNAW